ncbi:MAG: class IV adenylate cyclase [Pyrinomonadaceae bacterium]
MEIEKKYRLSPENWDRVKSDLSEIGAEFIAEDFEENILFHNDFLEENKALLRLRKTGRGSKLTFKQFVSSTGGVKQHVEHESEVENPEEIERIVESLGFEKRMVYEKRRLIWKFKEVEIVLDELPFGLYMEIEGALMAIAEAELYLGAEDFETEEKTYPALTKNLGERAGRMIEARFGNKDDLTQNN